MRAFVDTSALLALSHSKDQYHRRAATLAKRHEAGGGRYLSSTLVLGEFHNHLLHLRGPVAAHNVLTRLLEDPAHRWETVSDDVLRQAAAHWLGRFADQRFSLTDAVSFELMARESLTHAFAFDRHFEIAGYTLMR